MFTHVIVGVDGRGGGRDAAALAKAMAPARITLVSVYPVDPAISRGTVDEYFEILRSDALEMLANLRQEMGLEADVRAVGDLSPANALRRVAAEAEADLIVVGSAHHGRFTRILLGDVGRAVLHSAPCAVAVAPKGYADHPCTPRRVGVGYTDTPEGRAALRIAMACIQGTGGALTLVHSWEIPTIVTASPMYVPDLEQLRTDERAAAQRALDRGLETAGPQAAGRLEHGHPVDVLRAAAEDLDLLVVGSRGFGPARRVALGSTSDRLIHRTSIPVVVVPRPAGVEDETAETEGAAPAATA